MLILTNRIPSDKISPEIAKWQTKKPIKWAFPVRLDDLETGIIASPPRVEPLVSKSSKRIFVIRGSTDGDVECVLFEEERTEYPRIPQERVLKWRLRRRLALRAIGC